MIRSRCCRRSACLHLAIGALLFVTGWLIAVGPLEAEPVILHNQSKQPVAVRFEPRISESKQQTLPPNASLPLSVTGSVDIWFEGPQGSGKGKLWPYHIYRFSEGRSGRVRLERLPLGKPQTTSPYPEGEVEDRTPWTLRIKIAVDDDERTRREMWETKLRKRIEAASRLLEYYCGVRLEVVSVARWESKDSIRDFNLSLSEFEAKVSTQPAQLVIGFTSQYDVNRGRQRLGATRGPLRSHILIREHGPRIGESERLEVLLHELGHYLGAAHSPSRASLMRPILGDDQSNARSFQLAYDPINLLAMNLIGNQIRRRDMYSVKQIPLPVQQRLLDIYNWLAEQQPADRSARNMARVLCSGIISKLPRPAKKQLPAKPSPEELREKIEFRRSLLIVLQSLGRVADTREERALGADRLTEAYVRAAAGTAAQLPKKYAQKSFYFALAIAMDRGYLIRRYEPVAAELKIDTNLPAAVSRERFVGKATIWRRASLLQDFISAGVLAQIIGPEAAIDITTREEIKQSTDPAGFSFAAILASRAGIRLNQALSSDQITLSQLAETFTVERFVPPVETLRKFWTSAELEEDYGGTEGKYFQQEIDKLQQAVNDLPVYRGKDVRR